MPPIKSSWRCAVLPVLLCAAPGSHAATDEQLSQLVMAHVRCAAYANYFDDGACIRHYTAGYAAHKKYTPAKENPGAAIGAGRAEGEAFEYGMLAGISFVNASQKLPDPFEDLPERTAARRTFDARMKYSEKNCAALLLARP
jgi:hypothetical protein